MNFAKVARLPLCIVLVTLQFCSFNNAYEIPEVSIEVLSPKGFRASIPNEPNIALFVFQGNINPYRDRALPKKNSTLVAETDDSQNSIYHYLGKKMIEFSTGAVVSPPHVSPADASDVSQTHVCPPDSYRALGKKDVWTLSGEISSASPNGRWTFEDLNVELKEGDVINYYVLVSVDSVGYLKDNLKFTVTRLTSTNTERGTETNKECLPTLTKVRVGKACAGQTIFEDNFDTLNEDLWQIEHYIPDDPEYPFVSYQRQSSLPTVSVNNGTLRIAPELLQNYPGYDADSIYSGSLNFIGSCTGAMPTDCFVQASGSGILPPVVSGKLTSRSHAFKYGTVHIKAKLPRGDWIYPEILLEPILKKYGARNYASGVIKIATARGNRDLYYPIKNLCGNQMLYGGPIMDYKCRKDLIKKYKHPENKMWGDDFHVYSLKWTPDSITLLVDSKEWGKIEPGPKGMMEDLDPKTCSAVPRDILATRSKMAPFDEHFYLTLGVAAGSISEFDDELLNQGKNKPWHNQAVKARLNFWNDRDSWQRTWSDAELLVDYVKVVAL